MVTKTVRPRKPRHDNQLVLPDLEPDSVAAQLVAQHKDLSHELSHVDEQISRVIDRLEQAQTRLKQLKDQKVKIQETMTSTLEALRLEEQC